MESGSAFSDHWTGREIRRLKLVLSSLCSDRACSARLISRLGEYMEHADVKQHAIQLALKMVRTRSKEQSRDGVPAQFVRNVMCLLEAIKFPKVVGTCIPNISMVVR